MGWSAPYYGKSMTPAPTGVPHAAGVRIARCGGCLPEVVGADRAVALNSGQQAYSRAQLRIRVLGPMEVQIGQRRLDPPTGRLRTLLAALAMAPNESVSINRLTAILWGPDLPANPRRSVQTYITRVR